MITDRGRVVFNPVGAPPGEPGAPEPMTNLPQMSVPMVVETIHENGQWKVPGISPGEDNFGDGTMIYDEVAGILRHSYRSGGQPNGCVYCENDDPDNPYEGWEVPGGNQDPTKAFPADEDPSNAVNVDTSCMMINPITRVITQINGVRPGSLTITETETGHISSVQRRTSNTGTDLHLPESWDSYADEHVVEVVSPPATWQSPIIEAVGPPLEYSGGVGEASLFYNVFTNKVECWYEAKSQDEGNVQWGTPRKNRLGLRTAPLTNFDTAPVWTDVPALGASSWLYDPEDDANYVTLAESDSVTPVWGTMPGFTQRAHVSVNPRDGIRHMVAIAQKPATTAGARNASTGIGHWWQDPITGAWIQDVNNPLFDKVRLGWSPTVGVDFLNSPFLMWTPTKLYLGFWGNPLSGGVVNQTGNRLWMCECALPPL